MVVPVPANRAGFGNRPFQALFDGQGASSELGTSSTVCYSPSPPSDSGTAPPSDTTGSLSGFHVSASPGGATSVLGGGEHSDIGGAATSCSSERSPVEPALLVSRAGSRPAVHIEEQASDLRDKLEAARQDLNDKREAHTAQAQRHETVLQVLRSELHAQEVRTAFVREEVSAVAPVLAGTRHGVSCKPAAKQRGRRGEATRLRGAIRGGKGAAAAAAADAAASALKQAAASANRAQIEGMLLRSNARCEERNAEAVEAEALRDLAEARQARQVQCEQQQAETSAVEHSEQVVAGPRMRQLQGVDDRVEEAVQRRNECLKREQHWRKVCEASLAKRAAAEEKVERAAQRRQEADAQQRRAQAAMEDARSRLEFARAAVREASWQLLTAQRQAKVSAAMLFATVVVAASVAIAVFRFDQPGAEL